MKKTACLAAAAAVLLAGVSAENALAYFTTYTQAAGGMQLDLGFTASKPKEEISSWTKHVAVENTGTYEGYDGNPLDQLIDNDFSWAAENREDILNQWMEKYDSKSEAES